MAMDSQSIGDVPSATPQSITSTHIEKGITEAHNHPSTTEYQRPISKWRWFLVCVGLYLAGLLYGLDTTISADVQGPIIESLGEIQKLAWVGIGFSMGSVSVILVMGSCYGLFEVKYLLIGSIVVFEAGSALCGAAPNMNVLIVGRIIAGIGGAGMYLGALTYISIFTSLKERPIYNGLLGLCWGTGCILGPLIGGGFAVSSATWRWAFYINLPLAAAVSPVYLFLFPKYNPKPDVSGRAKLMRIDWVGACLNIVVFTTFLVALTFAGATWNWNNAGTITLWVVFGVALICFAMQQALSMFTTPERRLFPVQFLASRTMLLLYFGTGAAGTALSIAVYYVPLYFQFTRGDSAIRAAVRLLPFIMLNIFFVMVSGAVLPISGRYMPFYIATGVLIIVGGSLMHTVDTNTSTSAFYGYEILIAVGAGLTMQTGYSIAVAKVKPSEIPSALGFMNVAQLGSIAIALGIAGSIFQNVGFINLRNALAPYNFSDAELRSALGGVQSVILQSGNGAVRQLALDSIVKTMKNMWILTIAAGAVSLASGMLMKREKLQLELTAGG